jgi:hypothetical protein
LACGSNAIFAIGDWRKELASKIQRQLAVGEYLAIKRERHDAVTYIAPDTEYRFEHKCAECDCEMYVRNVSQERFEAARDRAWHRLERYGDMDCSPVVEENRIVYWNTVCKNCEDDWYDGQMAELYEG